jgi:hypothetical protein
MGGFVESAEIPALTAARLDLAGRVAYLPVRHHSPACAWHVDRAIRELRPDAVLIEGPRNANALVPLLADPETRAPVALYLTYVERTGDELPRRHGAWFPLCDYSPELAAIRAAVSIGARVEFIDLSLPELVAATGRMSTGTPESLLREPFFAHGQFIDAACQRTGARDGNDLWDHLFELDYREKSADQFFSAVLAYCAMVRLGLSGADLGSDGSATREQAMAAAIARETGRAVVLTGGLHTVALPHTLPAEPPKLAVAPEDAQAVLARYGFEQLDQLNGYASGMAGPEFYQREWENRPAVELLAEIGRECRERLKSVSTADTMAAWEHAQRLATLRRHRRPSREDLLDAVRSLFVKGGIDAEGVPVLAIARKALAGNRVGQVPSGAGMPPIVRDFRTTAETLRLRLDRPEASTVTLDLYRKERHRSTSRFLHRLRFLDVPFATFQRGPDFVNGAGTGRIQEVWQYFWAPQTESALILLARYGSTVEDAASALLLERFDEAERQGVAGSSSEAVRLVLASCAMGLHERSAQLMARTGALVARDASFIGVTAAMQQLTILDRAREPLQAQHLAGIAAMALAAYRRACYLIPDLANTAEEEEKAALEALNVLRQAVESLGDTAALADLRAGQLAILLDVPDAGSPAMQGGAAGTLYLDGRLTAAQVAGHLGGRMAGEAERGVRFLYGLMRTARGILWSEPDCLAALDSPMRKLPEDDFLRLVPHLRLAFADLAPRETDRLAHAVAERMGVAAFAAPRMHQVTEADAVRAFSVERMVEESLRKDGLDDWLA